MVAEPVVDACQIRRRWWHRGPFVRREVRLSVGTVLAFLFVFYVALPLLASHRAEVNSLAHIHFGYLAIGLLLEIGALAAYTQLTHAVLPPDGPKRFRLFRINMSTLALSHVSPGGTAPGAALGYRLLTQSGVSGSDAGFALGTQGIGSAVVLNVMFWLALVAFLTTHGFHAPTSLHGGQSQSAFILVFVAAGVGVILLGAFGGLFYLLTRGQERASRVIRRIAGRLRFLDADRTTTLVERLAARFAVLTENRSLTRRAIGWAAANWLLDAASLWVFVAAFGHFISPIDLLVAYGLANILAAVPITPAGLGVVEFVLVSMMTRFGPTAGAALSGVLAYRAVNFWLPIPFGGLAYGSLEVQRRPVYRRVQGFVSRKLVAGRAAADMAKARVPGVALGSNWLVPAGIGSNGTCAIGGTTRSGTSSTTDWSVADRIAPLVPGWSATTSAAAGTGATVTAEVGVPESTVRTISRASDTKPRTPDTRPGASDTKPRASATQPWAIPRTIPTSGRQIHRSQRPTSPPTAAERQRIPRRVDRAKSVPRAGFRARRGSRRVEAGIRDDDAGTREPALRGDPAG